MNTSQTDVVNRFEKKQIIFATFGLLLLMCLATLANSLNLYSVAKQTTQFVSHLMQSENFREVSLTLEAARSNSFQAIKFKSERPGRSFSLPAISQLELQPSLWKRFLTEQIIIPIDNPLQTGLSDHIIYEASRFRFIPYSILAWLILVLVSIPQTRLMKRKLLDQFEKDIDFERAQIQTELARQVRHNLRTPLAALMRIPSRLPDSTKLEKEVLSSSITQMRAIVSSLDDVVPTKDPIGASTDIYGTLIRSIREISLAVPTKINFSYEIDDALASALTSHTPHEFRALLGNIVNNSVDSIVSVGKIHFTVCDMGAEVKITIEDSGCGIPQEIHQLIFENGFSFN
ncbi:MAG: sensor histidine kinase, partial [Bdellovibrionales bacterium]|nr:sensor histidine kinase [Bdellovibrionales bacterium]